MTYFSLSFKTDNSKARSIRINNPGTELTQSEYEDALAIMVDNDIFEPSKGSITGVNKLESVTTSRKQLV